MTIKKLSEYKGASRFGNCTECGEMETDSHRLYRLQFNGVSICLCPDCFRRTRIAINEVIIDPQESDHKCHTCRHYTPGEYDGSCGSYICKNYNDWESEGKE